MTRTFIFNGVALEVNCDGSVIRAERSVLQKSKNGDYSRIIPAKRLTPVMNGPAGYYQVPVSNNNKVKRIYVHRLVWESFNGEIPDGLEVDHIDEDKSNNSLGNLCLKSRKQNMMKMINSNPHVLGNLLQNRK